MAAGEISMMLLICGVASIVGSQLGGRFTDKSGYARTLYVGLGMHCAVVALFFVFGGSRSAMYALLVFWSMAAWSSGPALQFRLISLAPESTSIIFSFYTSMIQFGMAAGAMIGGLVIQAGALGHVPAYAACSVFIPLLLLPKISRNSAPSTANLGSPTVKS